MTILRIYIIQIHVDRVEQSSSSSSQNRPWPNLLDEGNTGEAQAIVNVLNLSQNTISDMESGQHPFSSRAKLQNLQVQSPKSKKEKGILDSGLSLKSDGPPPPPKTPTHTPPPPTLKHEGGL